MKFSGFVDIQKPQKLVAEYFANPEYLKYYQDGFQRKEPVSGTMGEEGSVSKMYYSMGKKEMELRETILTNQLPEYFEAFYHHAHMDNTLQCRFIPLDENNTRYEYTFEYTRVSGFMPRLMMFFYPAMFKKHGEKWMLQFKEFVEKQ